MATEREPLTVLSKPENISVFVDDALRVLGESLDSRKHGTAESPELASSRMGYLNAPLVQVNFVERKHANYNLISRFLAITDSINHWTNFGPIEDITEKTLAKLIGLGDDHSVVLCSNGTVALEILTIAHEIIAGRRLRWVGSAFNFLNINRGQLRSTHLVDCNANGMLSLDELRRLHSDSYDGLIVTNAFGVVSKFDEYLEFANKSRKILVLDNAAGIGNIHPPAIPWQSLSLHHTKPFGFGEGGAMICPTEHAPLLRELISFGKGLRRETAQLSTNAKISDISAAFILARLYDSSNWAPKYREQSIRVTDCAKKCNLFPLQEGCGKIAMSLPFLSEKPVSIGHLRNPHITIGKSYTALGDLHPMASHISERTVNIPAHPDVRHLTDDILEATLHSLLA